MTGGDDGVTVYADILFFADMSLNWFSLILTSRLLKLKSTSLRSLSAAALGALAGILAVMLGNMLSVHIIQAASSVMMCAIAFSIEGVAGYIKACACLYASGLVLGGTLTFIYSFLNRLGLDIESSGGSSCALLILFSLISCGAGLLFERLILSSKLEKVGTVCIELDGKSITLPYFCDSGNLLRDPIGGRPAIVIERSTASGLVTLPSSACDASMLGMACEHSLKRRLRLLPAATVFGSGLMLGFLPDKVTIEHDGARREVDAVIAVTDERIDNRSTGESVAILPPALI